MILKPELALTDVGAIDSISGLARVTCLAGDDVESWRIEGDSRENIFFEHREESKESSIRRDETLSRLSSK